MYLSLLFCYLDLDQELVKLLGPLSSDATLGVKIFGKTVKWPCNPFGVGLKNSGKLKIAMAIDAS